MSKNTKSNTIRIIAGQWRGRRIPVLDQTGLRPTSDRVRETLFNWLMYDIREARCLDVFAGTGALGLECISRGAEYVRFIELNNLVAKCIQQNVELLQSGEKNVDTNLEKVLVTNADAINLLQTENTDGFNIIFLDPPFHKNLIEPIADLLEKNNYLAKSALIYVECETNRMKLKLPSNWILRKQGKTGQSTFFLYERKK